MLCHSKMKSQSFRDFKCKVLFPVHITWTLWGSREVLLIVALLFQSQFLRCQRGRKRAVQSLTLAIKCSGLELTNISALTIHWPEIVP